jgi:protein TonB
LERHKRYPRQARRRGEQGVVEVQFVVDHHGGVSDIRLLRDSGIDGLDAEAISVVQRAAPLPPPPGAAHGERVQVMVPVAFFIERR